MMEKDSLFRFQVKLLPKSRSEILESSLIAMVALVVRLLYLMELRGIPWFENPIMDQGYHDIWALSLIRGEVWQPEVYFRAPLYPFFLAGLYFIFGRHMFMVRLFHVLIGTATCVLLARFTHSLFRRPAGLIAGLVSGLYGMFVYFDVDLLIPVLILHLNLWFMIFLYQAVHLQSQFRWFLSGFFMGLSAIARPNVLMVAPVPILWPFFLCSTPKQALSRFHMIRILVFLVGLSLPILPVTLRNGLKAGDFMLISSQGGINLFIGNNPESNGIECYVPGARNTWWGGFHDYHRLAEEAVGRPLKASEASSYWTGEAIRFIKSQPRRAFDLTVAKTFHFWSAPEIGSNTGIYFFRHLSKVLCVLIWLTPWVGCPFGLLMPVAFLGLLLGLSRFKELFPLYGFIVLYSMSIILFYVNARYRLPVIPFLIVFAATGTVEFLGLLHGKQWGRSILLFALMVLVFWVVNKNPYRKAIAFDSSQGLYDLGVAYLNAQRYDEAERTFLQYKQIRPQAPGAYLGLGGVSLARGDMDLAAKRYHEALARDSTSVESYLGLWRIAQNQGTYEQALACLEQALRFDPHSPEALAGMGTWMASQARWQEAQSWYEKSLSVHPSISSTWESLALVFQHQDKPGEAEEALKRAEICKLEGKRTR